MEKKEIELSLEKIPETIEYIRAALIKRKVEKKEISRTLLTAEDVLVKMMDSSPDGTKVWVSIGGLFGNVDIRLSAWGEPFDSSDIEQNLLLGDSMEDEEANDVIRRMINKLYEDNLRIVNEHGYNRVVIRAKTSQIRSLILTLLALAGGVVIGLLLKTLLPDNIQKITINYILSPVYTMFMNALKMMIGPLVFCSVASSIADFSDLRALGKIAGKVVMFYMFTSVLAMLMGFCAYNIFPIGSPELASAVTDASADIIARGKTVSFSIKDTIVNIIPKNVISPFLNADMLQIIFMAIVMGLAAAALSKKMPQVKNTLVVLSGVCTKIITTLVSFIPLVVFCALAKMVLTVDISHLLNVFVWVPVVYFGDMLMVCVYMVLLLVIGGLNPLKFLKKFSLAMITAYSCASSSATLPTSVKQADAMGISKSVYSFSLPLGATINMDGTCVSLMITSLFMAKIFGITVTGSVLLSIAISIMVLSIGAPGAPGVGLICMTVLISQIGGPAEAVTLVMGLYPLVDMMGTCANVTGDAVGTVIVARRAKLLDMEKYNS